MARIAILESGKVINIVEATDEWVTSNQDSKVLRTLTDDSPVDIGWSEVGTELVAPTPTAEQIKAAIVEQIATMEREQLLPRVTREALLATAVTLAAAQGVSEATLYTENVAYRKMKDFDAAIAALRAQL